MRFWDIVGEFSAEPLRRDAEAIFVLGLAGDPEPVARARELILGGASDGVLARAEVHLVGGSPPYSQDLQLRLRFSDLLVSLPGGPGMTDLRPADYLEVNDPELVREAVLKYRPDMRVRLARRFPGFRELAADQVVREVSFANAEFAALAGVTQSLPFLAPLFPAVAGADVLMLTKNQVMMIYRLAAVYGEDLSVRARLREVAPVVGGAFGWRTLARQLAGAAPGGLGLPLKAGIAYAGTYTVGKAAQMVFDEGRRPRPEEMARLYEDGLRLAREAVDRIKERLSRKKTTGEPPPPLALPESTAEPLEIAAERGEAAPEPDPGQGADRAAG